MVPTWYSAVCAQGGKLARTGEWSNGTSPSPAGNCLFIAAIAMPLTYGPGLPDSYIVTLH